MKAPRISSLIEKKGSAELFAAVVCFDQFEDYSSRRLRENLKSFKSDIVKIEKFCAPNVIVLRTDNIDDGVRLLEDWLLSHFNSGKGKKR